MVALLAKYPPQGPVLDIGCGSGDLAIYLAKLGNQALGIDFVEAAILDARRKMDCLPAVVAPFVSPSPIPTPTPTATLTATLTPTATASPNPTGTSTLHANHPPVIENIELRQDPSSTNLAFFIRVRFHDADGNAIGIHYEIISSSIEASFNTGDTPIRPSPNQQQGRTVRGRWGCNLRSPYDITLEAVAYDQAGNRSNPVQFTIHCR